MALMQQQPAIIVHVVEQPVKSTTIGDVIIGAFGLTGALILVALLLGGVLGLVLIGFRKMRSRGQEYNGKPDAIHISPYC